MRTKGAKNFVSFEKRTAVETSSSKEVRHLANIKGSPLEEFRDLLKHQENFLDWVDRRHVVIVELKNEVRRLGKQSKGKGPTGAKEATFVKYRWYAEQLVLLEAINAFESFYKKTLVCLGTLLRDYVQPEAFRDIKIDAPLVWSTAGQISAPALMFEQSLFHDLEAVDKCLHMLVEDRRYNQNAPKSTVADRVKALRAIFQIRHTLSHNNGLVTEGDASKFKRLKFQIAVGEVIDPAKNYLGIAVFRILGAEANEITTWLACATAAFLQKCITNRGLAVPSAQRQDLESLLGVHPCWATITWS
jgi:hypothetical protein